MEKEEVKFLFSAGDIVKIKGLDETPHLRIIGFKKESDNPKFPKIKAVCLYFNKENTIKQAVLSFKDLELIYRESSELTGF
jgi:hypothetical protein